MGLFDDAPDAAATSTGLFDNAPDAPKPVSLFDDAPNAPATPPASSNPYGPSWTPNLESIKSGFVKATSPDAQTIQDALDVVLTNPLDPVGQRQQPGVAAQVVAGTLNAVNESTIGTLTDPVALVALASGLKPVQTVLGKAAPLVNRAVTAYFAAQMGKSVPEVGKQLGEVLATGTPEEKAKALAGAGLLAGMTGGVTAHAVKPGLVFDVKRASGIDQPPLIPPPIIKAPEKLAEAMLDERVKAAAETHPLTAAVVADLQAGKVISETPAPKSPEEIRREVENEVIFRRKLNEEVVALVQKEGWQALDEFDIKALAPNQREVYDRWVAAGKPEGAGKVTETPAPPAPPKEVIPSEVPKEEGQKVNEAGQLPLTETPPPVADKGPVGDVGPVEAKPVETASGQTQTGIKNAAIDAQRADRGEEPMLAPARLSNQQVFDEAMARIDREPGWQDWILADLQKQPRVLTPVESMAMLQRMTDLRNEYAKATRDGAQAYDDGRIEDVKLAEQRTQLFSDKLSELEKAVGTGGAGTEAGRALQIRKRMMNDDFTLANLELQKRKERGFAPITADERAQLQKVAEEHKIISDRLEKELAASEENRARSEAETLVAEARLATTRKLLPPPYLRDILNRFSNLLDKKADEAEARLKGKLFTLSPDVLLDLSIVGARTIKNVGLEFGLWSKAMVDKFGPKIKEHLETLYEASKREFYGLADAISGEKDAPAVKRLASKADASEIITNAKEKIAAKIEAGEHDAIFNPVQQLVRGLVEANPKIEREALIDEVHRVLQEFIPEITRLDTMHAISGLGRFTVPSQDLISKTVADLKTQTRFVAQQELVKSKQPIPRTGFQPRPLSDKARAEEQRLNELKRQFGVVVTDPAAQLASALQSRKTYLIHRLADLRLEISTKQRLVKSPSSILPDKELLALQTEYQKVKAEHAALFDASQERALQAAMNGVERSIADLERRIKENDLAPREVKKLTSPELEAARARRDALRDQLQEMRDLANPKKTPEERALQALKTRISNRMAFMQEKIAMGDFSKRPVKPKPTDPEVLNLLAQKAKIEETYKRGRELDRLANRTRWEKFYAGAKETLNLPRNMMSSWDVSAVLRQGGFIGFGHPLRAAQSVLPMFKSLVSEHQTRMIEQEILSRPTVPLYKESGLYLAPHDSLILSAQEEMIMSSLASRIPGLRASNRAYITFLNKLRADSFDTMIASVGRRGESLNPLELKAIANYINVATGRSNIGKAAAGAETLATVFFSPKLMASRFQLLAGQPFYHGSMRTRVAFAKEYGRTLLGLSVVFGLGALAGGTIEDDPRSSDFGKIRFGNTRVDPLMGLAQNTVLLSRLASGQTMTAKGQILDIRGDKVKFGTGTAADVIARFLRAKLAPVLGAGVDVVTGRNVVGEPVTAGTVAGNLLTPLSMQDILKVMKEQGIPMGTALGILSLFGMGLQYYEPKKPK